MSTKRFCDGPCGKELAEANRHPETFRIGAYVMHVSVGDRGGPSYCSLPDLCRYCIIDALVKLDDRPGKHAELVRLVKAWQDARTEGPLKKFELASNKLAAYVTALP
jgi:hypothetical protein